MRVIINTDECGEILRTPFILDLTRFEDGRELDPLYDEVDWLPDFAEETIENQNLN